MFKKKVSELLSAVLESQTSAEAVLSHYFRRHPQYGSHDRRALADAVYGCLRRLRSLGYALQHPERPQWQITKEEARARIHLWMTSSGGAPRELLSENTPPQAAPPAAVAADLPDWLYESFHAERGEAETQELAAALLHPAPIVLRVNTLRTTREAALRHLHNDGIDATPTSFSPWGIKLAGRVSLTDHPLYQSGAIEIQDEGSQLISLLVAPRRTEIIVDFCAGAGGKTLHLGALMANRGTIYACDPAAHRLDQLRERARRAGLTTVRVVRTDSGDDPLAMLRGKADRVLVDAPCTSSGTLRRHPDRKWYSHDLTALTAEQNRILCAAAHFVRPGGKLIYATCSLLRAENDAVITQFRATHPNFIALSIESFYHRIALPHSDQFALRLSPHQHNTDGFYAVVLSNSSVS